MLNKEHYAKCFLIGGLFIGILSGAPGFDNCNCCCMWVILGGLLSGYLLCRWAGHPVTEGEGALVGLLSGAIGAVIQAILAALRYLVMGTDQIRQAMDQVTRNLPFPMPPGGQELLQQLQDFLTNPMIVVGFQLVFSLIIGCIFAPAGAFLAVTIWGKQPRQRPPGTYPSPGPSVHIPPPMAPPTGPGRPPGPPPAPTTGKDESGFFFPR